MPQVQLEKKRPRSQVVTNTSDQLVISQGSHVPLLRFGDLLGRTALRTQESTLITMTNFVMKDTPQEQPIGRDA